MTGSLLEDRCTFWLYLARFFSEWEMLRTKVVEKMKIHIFGQ